MCLPPPSSTSRSAASRSIPSPSGDTGPGITYGIPPQLDPLNFVHDIAKDGIKAVLQLLFNIVLFMPLGFIAKRFLRLASV